MKLTHDEILGFDGIGGCDSQCHVRVFEAAGKLPVVIVGELDDNPGTSVTNYAEHLASFIQEAYLPDGREYTYVEFYPRRGSDAARDSGYSITHFDLDKRGPQSAGAPNWQYATKEQIEALVEGELPTWPENGSYNRWTAKQ